MLMKPRPLIGELTEVSFVHLTDVKNQAKACLTTLLLGFEIIYVGNIVEDTHVVSSVKVRSEFHQSRNFM